jgi:hypothetical protein
MTNGIVSIRKDGMMLFKIIVGHDGQNAGKVASRVSELNYVPTAEELADICAEEDFGCNDCLIILEHNPDNWNHPKILKGKDIDWDEDDPENQRYYDTFHVAEFNPRWKYGTAPNVKVIDLDDQELPSPTHLWSDEQVAGMKAKGIITEEQSKISDDDSDIPF